MLPPKIGTEALVGYSTAASCTEAERRLRTLSGFFLLRALRTLRICSLLLALLLVLSPIDFLLTLLLLLRSLRLLLLALLLFWSLRLLLTLLLLLLWSLRLLLFRGRGLLLPFRFSLLFLFRRLGLFLLLPCVSWRTDSQQQE